ncbi:hypothetical protein DOJK_00233 [Patescibacteria group bacterium]|nr:hypothetical protein [Candidatus Dojkabacteria bacterium]CAG1020283.1 hypothetical protein DOJK_00233 [Patescibacteria group bacterium]
MEATAAETTQYIPTPEDITVLVLVGVGIFVVLLILAVIWIYLKRGDSSYKKEAYVPPPPPLPTAFQQEIQNIKEREQTKVEQNDIQNPDVPIVPVVQPEVTQTTNGEPQTQLPTVSSNSLPSPEVPSQTAI